MTVNVCAACHLDGVYVSTICQLAPHCLPREQIDFARKLRKNAADIHPLPRQITAVTEAMLPRQPLRCILASDDQCRVNRTRFAAVYRRFGAPFGCEPADALVDRLIKLEQVADDASVEVGAIGVGVGKIGG